MRRGAQHSITAKRLRATCFDAEVVDTEQALDCLCTNLMAAMDTLIPGGYSVTFNARYIRFNAQFYMVLYIYVYKNSAR